MTEKDEMQDLHIGGQTVLKFCLFIVCKVIHVIQVEKQYKDCMLTVKKSIMMFVMFVFYMHACYVL